ncbi:PREDICTED: LOW QUALITY PROTEIN: uncharacterized protein LOC104397812, partial [Chaetura pelagica]|uniref:LOW QUALITY PROTEIN: uncharacterized protein LOC104397812 n=1 Tax=Chaetura pelagica TaxID=8897 RepID=UPI0005239B37
MSEGTEQEDTAEYLTFGVRHGIEQAAQKHCFVCSQSEATITCAEMGCDCSFHLPCAAQGECVTQYNLAPFRAFCWEHGAQQAVEAALEENDICLICLEPVVDIRQYAVCSGFTYFQCPHCRNSDQFQLEMCIVGIQIPLRGVMATMENDSYASWFPAYKMQKEAADVIVDFVSNPGKVTVAIPTDGGSAAGPVSPFSPSLMVSPSPGCQGQDQKIKFLECIHMLCRTTRHSGLTEGLDVFCHRYELAENIKELLEEEPRHQLQTQMQQLAMLAIAELSSVQTVLEGKEQSLLQVCFSRVFLLPPKLKMRKLDIALYSKTLKAMDAMLKELLQNIPAPRFNELLQTIFQLLLNFTSSEEASVRRRSVRRIGNLVNFLTSRKAAPHGHSQASSEDSQIPVLGKLLGQLLLLTSFKDRETRRMALAALRSLYILIQQKLMTLPEEDEEPKWEAQAMAMCCVTSATDIIEARKMQVLLPDLMELLQGGSKNIKMKALVLFLNVMPQLRREEASTIAVELVDKLLPLFDDGVGEVRELAILLFTNLVRVAGGKKRQMKSKVRRGLLLLCFHLRDKSQCVAKSHGAPDWEMGMFWAGAGGRDWDMPIAACSLQLQLGRSRAEEYLHQSLPYLQDPRATVREETIRLIGIVARKQSKEKLSEIIGGEQGQSCDGIGTGPGQGAAVSDPALGKLIRRGGYVRDTWGIAELQLSPGQGKGMLYSGGDAEGSVQTPWDFLALSFGHSSSALDEGQQSLCPLPSSSDLLHSGLSKHEGKIRMPWATVELLAPLGQVEVQLCSISATGLGLDDPQGAFQSDSIWDTGIPEQQLPAVCCVTSATDIIEMLDLPNLGVVLDLALEIFPAYLESQSLGMPSLVLGGILKLTQRPDT